MKGTQIKLDFNVEGINQVIKQTKNLENSFKNVGTKIDGQARKVDNLLKSVEQLHELLNNPPEFSNQVESFSQAVMGSLSNAIDTANNLHDALINVTKGVDASVLKGLENITNVGQNVVNSSPTSYSKSILEDIKSIQNVKTKTVSKATKKELEGQIVGTADALNNIFDKYENGLDDLKFITPQNAKDVVDYTNKLSALQGMMNKYVSLSSKGKTSAEAYSKVINKLADGDLKYAFTDYGKGRDKEYGMSMDLASWKNMVVDSNKDLFASINAKSTITPTVDTKEAEKQAENSAPIKVTVDKDALTNDITTAIQSKEYTINVKPQQNIADDIQKQLEGKVANINIVAGASKGVASVNSQISDFQSAYDKYVGIVNSGKGSTASLLKQYPLLSDYKKGMDVEKTKSELTGKFANQITSGSSKEIAALTDNLNKLTNAAANSKELKENLTTIGNSMQAIAPPDIDVKVLNLVDALEFLKSSLASLKIEESPFIKSLNNLLAQGDALKDLATIISNGGKIKTTDAAVKYKKGIGQINKADVNWAYRNQDALGYEDYKGLEDVVIKQAELQGRKIEDKSQLQNTIASVFSRSGMDYISKATDNIDKTSDAMNNLQVGTTQSKEAFNSAKDAVKAYNDALTEMRNNPTDDTLTNAVLTKMQAENAVDAYTGLKNQYAKTTQVNKIRDSVSKDINQNSKMPLDMLQRYQSLQKAMEATYDSQGNKIAVTTEEYNKMQSVYSNLRAEMQATGQVGNNLFTKLGTGLGARIVQFTSFYLSFYRVIQYMRQGIETLEQFDTTLTKISYTMDVSESTLKDMGNSMQTIASDLSAPLENVEKIYTVYANMKTDPKEVAELTKYTTILSNLAGIDASAAADDVQGVIQQFGLAADDTSHIVDAFNYISANIAVDYSKGIEGLSEAVQGSGNVAKMAGLSFEQYGSVIAKVMEQTRMDGSRISNALRTIMTRLSKASTMDESVDNSTLSKASEALNKIGIQVYTTSGEYREFDTIMTELAAKWDGLTDAQRENISFAIAATRQTAMLKAVLNNWTDSMNLATEATNDNGSALENQEKYEQSYAARLQKIKTGLQNFAVDFFDNSAFDAAIDSVGTLTSMLEKLGTAMGDVGSISGILATRSVLSNKGALGSFMSYNPYAPEGERFNINKPFSFGKAERIEWNNNLPSIIDNYKGKADYINGGYYPTDETEEYLKSLENLTEEEKIQLQMLAKSGDSTSKMAYDMQRLGSGAKIAATGTRILSAALTGIAVGIVVGVITKLISLLDEYSNKASELNDAVKDYNDNANVDTKQYNEALQTISSIDDEFQVLSEGIGSEGQNLSLTNNELDRYHNISNQVANLIPELVSGYDEQGNAIVRLTDKYTSFTEAYQDAYLQQRQNKFNSDEGQQSLFKTIENMGYQSSFDRFSYDATKDLEWAGPFYDAALWVINKTNGFGSFDNTSIPSIFEERDIYEELLKKNDKDALKTLQDAAGGDKTGLSTGFVKAIKDKNGEIIDQEFDRDALQKEVNSLNAKIKNAEEGVRNSITDAILASNNLSNDTKLFLQSVIKDMDASEFDSIENEEDFYHMVAEIEKKFKGFSEKDRKDFLSLKSYSGTSVDEISKYKNKRNDFASRLGFKSVDKFMDYYGLSDQNSYMTTLSYIYSSLSQKGSNLSNDKIQSLMQKYGVKDLTSAKNFNNIVDRFKADYYDVTIGGKDAFDETAFERYINNLFYGKVSKFDFKKEWIELGGNEGGQKTQQALLDLANAGRLTIDTFKNAEGADLWIKKLGVSAEDVIPKINQLADSAKQLGALSGNVNSLREAYGEKRDEGVVGADTLSSMSDTFGQLDYWKQYEQVVGTKSSTLAQVKAASDKLLTEYVNTGDYLAQLSNDNKQYYIDQLSDMGVANAVEVVNNKLQQQDNIIKDIKNSSDFGTLKENAQMAATNFTTLQNATYGELIAMANLGNVSKYTQAVLAQLAMTKIDWGGLNANAAVNQLVAVAKAAGVAMSSISQLSILQSKGFIDKNGNIKSGATYTVGKGRNKKTYTLQEYYDTFLSKTKLNPKELDKTIQKNIKAPKINMSTAGIDSKNSKSKSSKSDSDKDTKQQFDWLERRVTVITSKVDLLKSKLENLFSMKKKQSNLNKQIKDQTKLIKTYTKQVDIYGKKAGAVKLSSSLKKKVRNGRLKGTKAQLIQKYGEKTANKIEKYQDWYDKKQAAKKNKQEAIAARRQLKIDKQQLYVDKYNAQAEYKDLQSTSGMVYAKKRNEALTQEYKYIQKSYKHQIKIAKINHDSVQVAKLQLELRNKEVEIQKKKFDNVADQYDKLVNIMGYGIDRIEGQISLITAKGANVDVVKYRDEAQQHLDKQALLRLEEEDLRKQLAKIKPRTTEWYEAQEKLNSVITQQTDEEVKSIEAMNKVREAYTALYNAIRDQIRRAASEQSFGRELLSNYSMFDYDTGAITDYGKAYSSSIVSELYRFNEAASRDKAELDRLKSYRSGETGVTQAGLDLGYQSRKVLEDEIDDVWTKWQEDLKDISGLQSDIFKFVEDSLKKEEDLLKKLIDKRKEELDAAKDLHDYQKSIQEKTKNINDIQRQISAYRGDTSQEGMSKLQQLQQQLVEAQEDLQETEYDKYISDQKQMLDNLYTDYQDMLEALLNDFKSVVESGLDDIKQYTKEGNDIFVSFLDKEFGYKMQYSEDGSASGVELDSANISNFQKRLSGTVGDTGGSPSKTTAANNAARTVQQTKEDYWKSVYNSQTVKQAGDVFKWATYKANGKKESDFKTSINKYLFKNNDKKVLSNSGLERMRLVLGIADNSEMLEILQWLSKNKGNIPHVKGFAKGGIVGDVVKRNGDDGFATLKVGEAVLTPLQAQQFKELVTSLPSLNGLVNGFTNVKDVGLGVQTSDTYNSTFNFEISDVQNATELLNAIKSDDKVQRALQEVTIKQLNKGSRLGVKKIG